MDNTVSPSMRTTDILEAICRTLTTGGRRQALKYHAVQKTTDLRGCWEGYYLLEYGDMLHKKDHKAFDAAFKKNNGLDDGIKFLQKLPSEKATSLKRGRSIFQSFADAQGISLEECLLDFLEFCKMRGFQLYLFRDNPDKLFNTIDDIKSHIDLVYSGKSNELSRLIQQSVIQYKDPFSRRINLLTNDWYPRKHISSEIEKYIRTNPKGYITIIGEAGAGKSSIMADAVKSYREKEEYICVWHFIQYKTDYDRTISFAKTLYERLSLFFSLDEFKENYEHFCKNADYPLTQAFIHEIIEESALQLSSSDKKIVIFLDALDEADITEVTRMATTFAIPSLLPDGVIVVVSSRHSEKEKYADSPPPLELVLNKEQEFQREDIEGFIEHKLQENKDFVEAWLDEYKIQYDDFKQLLCEKSDYLFLYLAQVFKDLSSYSPNKLPNGLRGYYDEQYNRLMNNDKSRTKQKVILGGILAFAPDLSLLRLSQFAKDVLESVDLLELTESWIKLRLIDLLTVGDESYFRFAHLSFYEYLSENRKVELEAVLQVSNCYLNLATALNESYRIDSEKFVFNVPMSERFKNEFFRIFCTSMMKAKMYEVLSERLTNRTFCRKLISHDESMTNEIINHAMDLYDAIIQLGEDGKEVARRLVHNFYLHITPRENPIIEYGEIVLLASNRRSKPFFETLKEERNSQNSWGKIINERKKSLNTSKSTDGNEVPFGDLGWLTAEELREYAVDIKERFRRTLQYHAALREYQNILPYYKSYYENGEIAAKELSILFYELGYSNYVLGNFETSITHYEQGEHFARIADDGVGIYISKYEIYHAQFMGGLKEAHSSYSLMIDCLRSISDFYRKGIEVARSRYWIFNIQQRAVIIATVLEDVTEAELRFEHAFHTGDFYLELSKDNPTPSWLRMYNSAKAGICYLNGDYEGALKFLSTFLNCGLDKFGAHEPDMLDTSLYVEESSRSYYYAGLALKKIGQNDLAASVLKLGLNKPVYLGNYFFQGLITKELSALNSL
ncbi:ATP-binding protein [Alteromonas sp. a30]|uniref:ATP-binding protein n=1 Tax=Alteromonas sp. a30 TaxID=2730917 RepID=UPI002282039A|nr:ATP-binding protein [Alteromonas sp. a30]MCY7297379.1 ATP-binding protein [Alteromonas sp. a30]